MRVWFYGLLLVPTFLGTVETCSAETSVKCFVELRAYPGPDPAMWDALYAARDGKVYTGLCNEGESAHLYVYDPHKDVNTLLYDMAEVLGERGRGIRVSIRSSAWSTVLLVEAARCCFVSIRARRPSAR